MFDPALIQAAQRRRLATQLRAAPTAERREIVQDIVIATGGTLVMPQPSKTMDTHHCELSILGLYHSGASLDEVIANWIICALRATAMPSAA